MGQRRRSVRGLEGREGTGGEAADAIRVGDTVWIVVRGEEIIRRMLVEAVYDVDFEVVNLPRIDADGSVSQYTISHPYRYHSPEDEGTTWCQDNPEAIAALHAAVAAELVAEALA